MQKKLSDYFNILIEAKQILKEYYDDWALLRHETDAVIFAGSLIGLRVLDCNLYLKEDDLNYPHLDVDLNLYIKLPSIPVEEVLEHDVDASTSNLEANENNPDIKTVLDQKHYLEERNRALMSNIENLQQRLSMLEEMQKHRTSTTSGEEVVKDLPIEEARNIGMSSLNKVEEIETAMALLEKSVHEKQDTIVSLRQQMDDIKKINLDLYQKLRIAEETGKSREKATSKLQLELDASRNHSRNKISHLEISLTDTERRLKKSEDFVATLQFELNQKTDFSSKLQNELLEAKDMNNFLTDSLKAERMVREDLDAQLENSKNTEQDYSKVKMEREALQRKIMEYERTLEELGVTLSKSKLEVDCLKEDMAPLVDAQWESDKETTSCKACQQKFSLSRRKHHCRNCGGIFCNACSENTMPLPSSAKPVRVCDQCYAVLLQRFSTKNLPSQSEDAPED
uniref:FYVE-type domain-containing protein n=1 Tax=Romanomermis culicivorax TaxID=13658 RepID=A0A915IRP7_ROMCU